VICQTGHSRSSFERYGLNVRCGTCPWRIVTNSAKILPNDYPNLEVPKTRLTVNYC